MTFSLCDEPINANGGVGQSSQFDDYNPIHEEGNLFSYPTKLENIPYYIQQLGFETFRIVDDARRKSALPADVDSAYAHLSGFNRDQYEQLMLTLSVSQKKLLIALARERTDEFGDAYRRRYALGVSSTVNSAKAKLREDGLIERSDGRYVVADPFFAQFLRMA